MQIKKKEERLFCRDRSHLASYICRVLHNMRRGWCFPAGTTSHLTVFKSLLLRLINLNRMLWFVDVFVAYPESFFKELIWPENPELGTERKAWICLHGMRTEFKLGLRCFDTDSFCTATESQRGSLSGPVRGQCSPWCMFWINRLFVWFYCYVHALASRRGDECFGSVLQDTQTESEVNGETLNIITLCCHTHLDLYRCTHGNVVFAWVREYSVFSLPLTLSRVSRFIPHNFKIFFFALIVRFLRFRFYLPVNGKTPNSFLVYVEQHFFRLICEYWR